MIFYGLIALYASLKAGIRLQKMNDMNKLGTGKYVGLIAMAGMMLLLTACNEQKKPLKISGMTMGTTYHIVIVPNGGSDKGHLLKQEIDHLLTSLNREMSIFVRESEISRFNVSDSTDWMPVSAGFLQVVQGSLDISQRSEGFFDVTIGPLIDLWGFGKKSSERIPSEAELVAVDAFIGYRKIKTRGIPRAIRKDTAKLRMNLASIAKGYGVDRVSTYLEGKGFLNFLVEIGGEVRVKGTKFGQKWRIGVVTPDTLNEYHNVVNLTDISMATSGDYFNYFEKNGKRYSHTIDPSTRKPITHKLASVTVAHPSCMYADGYATAINVMGPEKGYAFAVKEKLPIYMIIRDRKAETFSVKMTPSFRQFFKKK